VWSLGPQIPRPVPWGDPAARTRHSVSREPGRCTCTGTCSTRATLSGVTRDITQRELRNNSGEIMRQLDQGESFIVTRNGVPVGELSPLRRHRFVRAEAALAAFRGAPRVEFDRLRADLDRAASQEIAPRG
jgi:antitoxin (DNA-binding transcriptional repressor) of toxin-antitoxin stability system